MPNSAPPPLSPSSSGQLLGAGDPPPFRVREGRLDSPFVLAADHAGQLLPRALGTLGLSAAELATHIAWDIGIGGVTEQLAQQLGAFMIRQVYSRLVIDCNRPRDSSTSIVDHSEHTSIPGNRGVTPEQAEQRAQAVFH